jgi:iron complex outermembrane receptor protein
MNLRILAASLALAGLSTHHASAQTAGGQQRIEITGSSIKRIQTEGVSPLQVIGRDSIERAGITSAEQLISQLSSNGNGIDNMITNQGGDFLNSLSSKPHNNGAASASLRGLGAGYTLVLLNGRRLSTHGLNGQSVDVNQIPLAAVDRVEILKDGASAIYGTDAIGGVINFILRKDYSGLEASAFVDQTQHGGGNIGRASLLYGLGNFATDRYNLTASLAYKTNSRLRGSQRSFNNGIQPSLGLSPDTTGAPYANIGTGGGTAIASAFQLPGYPTVGNGYSRVSLLALNNQCNTVPDMYVYRGDITGFPRNNAACAWDYGRQWSMMQPVDALNFVGKANFALGADHTAFVEFTASTVKSALEYTPIQLTTSGYRYPASGPYYQNLAVLAPTYFKATNTDATDPRVFFDATKPLAIRWRCLECGPRQQDTTTDAYRVLVGMEGSLGAWDYKWGLSSGQSAAKTKLGDGNMYITQLAAAMASGKINPFLAPGQSQTAEGLQLINGAKARGASLYDGKATEQQVDLTFSRELFNLPAGAVSGAFGADMRHQEFNFDNTQPSDINGVTSPPSLSKAKRDISAVFTELNVPVVKNLEMQLAVRYDRYSDFGSTTNPKAGLIWKALPQLSIRGSYSRGFHAPDFDSLYGGGTVGQFNSDINDPVLCPNGVELQAPAQGCGIRPGITTTANPALKPERSKQWSFGFVVQPTETLSATVDFWKIELTDRISVLSGQALIQNYASYSQYVTRAEDGSIDFVQAPYLNLAGDQTNGVDINLSGKFKTAYGDFNASLEGTYVNSYKSRFSAADPWVERISSFGDATFGFDLHVRWKHAASVNWSQGPWAATFTQLYTSGYRDEVDGYGSGVILQNLGYQSRVKDYTLYNLSGSYTGMKNLTLSAGIKNLFDTKPSFSLHNVDNIAGAGWDSRVADPRGRAFTLGVTYKFF